MHAIPIDDSTDAATLLLTGVPSPRLEPGHVVVDVAAAGVNNADLAQRRGAYPPPPGASPILGLEVSGTIASVADDVVGWRVGDRVCALLSGGGYATQAVVPVGQLLPVPDGMDLVAAAGLPEAACTVHANIPMIRPLRHDRTLLVHGGTGGVGSHAVAWAKAIGATVVTTSGGPAKRAAAERLGADVAIDYRAQDFAEVVREVTDGRGVDAILDVVGPDYLERNLDALAVDGHLAVIAFARRVGELPFDVLVRKRATITGTTLRARSAAQKAAVVAGVREHVWPLVAAGAIAPVVDRVLPLAEAGRAHDALAAGDVVGKVLLAI